jgi:hypothetical protein
MHMFVFSRQLVPLSLTHVQTFEGDNTVLLQQVRGSRLAFFEPKGWLDCLLPCNHAAMQPCSSLPPCIITRSLDVAPKRSRPCCSRTRHSHSHASHQSVNQESSFKRLNPSLRSRPCCSRRRARRTRARPCPRASTTCDRCVPHLATGVARQHTCVSKLGGQVASVPHITYRLCLSFVVRGVSCLVACPLVQALSGSLPHNPLVTHDTERAHLKDPAFLSAALEYR